MTITQLRILNELRKKSQNQQYTVQSLVLALEKDKLSLQKKGYVVYLNSLTLTKKGHQFIEEFCDACECMPCDCGYGS